MSIFEYPILDMKDNLVITKGKEVIAYYKVPSISVTISNHEKKNKSSKTLAECLENYSHNNGLKSPSYQRTSVWSRKCVMYLKHWRRMPEKSDTKF